LAHHSINCRRGSARHWVDRTSSSLIRNSLACASGWYRGSC
jgi:hypothetical protein